MKLSYLLISSVFILALVYGTDVKLDLATHTGVQYTTEVKVDKGYNFSVSLKSNPSTGYSWVVSTQDLQKSGLGNVLTYLGSEYVHGSTNGTVMAGSSGVQTLTFEVSGIGSGNLNLYYAQPWTFNAKLQAGDSVESFKAKVIPVFSSL